MSCVSYLGHCAVPFYRETSVEALKYRIQIVINPDTVHVSNANARMRALFWSAQAQVPASDQVANTKAA